MRALGGALIAFVVLVAAQLIVWRWRRPASQYASLLMLFVAVYAGFTGLWYLQVVSCTAFEYLNFMILYLTLFLAYGVTYSAVQADSPTMGVLLEIERAGASGVSRDELLGTFTDEVLIAPRLEDLVSGRLARLDDGRYVITSRGAVMADANLLLRRALGTEKGG